MKVPGTELAPPENVELESACPKLMPLALGTVVIVAVALFTVIAKAGSETVPELLVALITMFE